jgi:hypothetical protein
VNCRDSNTHYPKLPKKIGFKYLAKDI